MKKLSTANVILNCEILNTLLLSLRGILGCMLSPILSEIACKVLASAIRNKIHMDWKRRNKCLYLQTI